MEEDLWFISDQLCCDFEQVEAAVVYLAAQFTETPEEIARWLRQNLKRIKRLWRSALKNRLAYEVIIYFYQEPDACLDPDSVGCDRRVRSKDPTVIAESTPHQLRPTEEASSPKHRMEYRRMVDEALSGKLYDSLKHKQPKRLALSAWLKLLLQRSPREIQTVVDAIVVDNEIPDKRLKELLEHEGLKADNKTISHFLNDAREHRRRHFDRPDLEGDERE